MSLLLENLDKIQKQSPDNLEVKNLGDSIKKALEDLSRLGFEKKPEYTIPQTDTIGRGYYSMRSQEKE